MARLIPAVLSMLLLSAHFLRQGELGLVATSLASLGLLLCRQRFVAHVFLVALPALSLLWVGEAAEIATVRMTLGQPWLRMAIILGAVAVLTALSGIAFLSTRLRERYSQSAASAQASSAAFFIVGIALWAVMLKVPQPMLLAQRFAPWTASLEILALATFAAFVAGRFLDDTRQASTRRFVWLLFCAVFFAQFVLGLTVDSRFLMASQPHLPVPALIAAGPIYRGEGLFMPILFGATLLLVGPAWCSHLCYIGALDHEMSRRCKRPLGLPKVASKVRVGLLVAVLGAALLLRSLGASPLLAGGLAAGFGALGLVVMLLVSSRFGVMVHCTVFCPMGLFAAVLGKVSPFRMKIGPGCTDCGACGRVCRYDALRPEHLAARSPGLSCTLCGDCLSACPARHLHYTLVGVSPQTARSVFAALASSLVALFLALARL
ncbi:MAG: 4Fe-4S binding protein [Myxococcota bacterium]|jgi:NAD-dependent dihydropyrimidine dehydrogenase PreA subunit|nr:4Fe-4S binding protein [Myxococcota bacterium]